MSKIDRKKDIMIDTIVVGYGAHPHSDQALAWAACLAATTSTPPRVVVVNALHPTVAEYSPEAAEEFATFRRETLAGRVEQLGLTNVEIVVRDGDAVDVLEEVAADRGADLIVVGHRDSGALGGFGAFGAAEALLRRGTVPFLVVGDHTPVGFGEHSPRFLVGIDGTETNKAAVATIATLAADLAASTVPVYAVYTGASTTRREEVAVVGEAEAARIAALLDSDEPLDVINEQPLTGLLDSAKEHAADIIAVGTQGHRSLFDFVASQFARRLLEHADRPVLIVPHAG